jgi:hypothetical protein
MHSERLNARDQIRLMMDEFDLMFADGFDDAIIGHADRSGMQPVVAYDTTKVIEILQREMSQEDAEEFFAYNVLGAYVGEGTPIFITLIGEV